MGAVIFPILVSGLLAGFELTRTWVLTDPARRSENVVWLEEPSERVSDVVQWHRLIKLRN